MRERSLARIALATFGILVAQPWMSAQAATSKARRPWAAVNAGFFQAPWPSLITFSLELFPLPWISIGPAYGTGTSDGLSGNRFQSYGGSVALYLFPKARITPTARASAFRTSGLDAAGSDVLVDSPFGEHEIRGLKPGTRFSVEAGLDWKWTPAFRVGAGYGIPLTDSSGGLPYMRFGAIF